jgi:CDP-paratose 2-epimerase
VGGSRHSNCSMLEAIALCEEISGRPFRWSYAEDNRVGDHVWWISDVSKFKAHYPHWEYTMNVRDIVEEIAENLGHRLR